MNWEKGVAVAAPFFCKQHLCVYIKTWDHILNQVIKKKFYKLVI